MVIVIGLSSPSRVTLIMPTRSTGELLDRINPFTVEMTRYLDLEPKPSPAYSRLPPREAPVSLKAESRSTSALHK